MRQRWATPACKTRTATSALVVASAASVSRESATASHASFVSTIVRCSSSSSVWKAPILTCGFSSTLRPLSRSSPASASKSSLSTLIVRLNLTRCESIEPDASSLCTLRSVTVRTRSPCAMRLYRCHRSSVCSTIIFTLPLPSFPLTSRCRICIAAPGRRRARCDFQLAGQLAGHPLQPCTGRVERWRRAFGGDFGGCRSCSRRRVATS